MGPICGFRLVNLRVRDKVAYPDLTVDLGAHSHVVVGLENGGGKSTLLGFLIHVLLPGAAQFLPRVAQRRQQKRGAEKRLEQYIPGGEPTHVILDVTVPAARSRQEPGHVLLGACLFRPAGAAPHVTAEEYFWSLPAGPWAPSLADLPLRAEGGRLLDHREWKTYLETLRRENPAAQIKIIERHHEWDGYLRRELRIDVEFVKSWLLSMNQDGGAADHVFTYASARTFLNSLVGAIAPPDLIAELKAGLTAMGREADSLALDRRRLALISSLATQTGELADQIAAMDTLDTERTALIDALISARRHLARSTRHANDAASQAQAAHDHADQEVRAAVSAYADAHGREVVGKRQHARLLLARTRRELRGATADKDAQKALAKQHEAAVIVVEARTVQARLRDIAELLTRKSRDGEPLRRSAAAAALAWREALAAAGRRLEEHDRTRAAAQESAAAAEEHAQAEWRTAAARVASCDSEYTGLQERLAAMDKMLAQATARGDLRPGEDPAAALREAEDSLTELGEQQQTCEAELEAVQGELDACAARQSALAGSCTQAHADVVRLDNEAGRLQDATADLTQALAGSGLVDLDPLHLDDHAPAVAAILGQVAEQAKASELTAAVDAAAARRAAQSLRDTGLLPPRRDVTALCRQAQERHWGARSGWSYLAQLPAAVAEQAARNHPALADGIIVNIPEDLPKIVELVTAARADLEGPLVIAGPQVLHAPEQSAPSEATVVLPDEAYWSPDAAQAQSEHRSNDHARHQDSAAAYARRYEEARTLADRLSHWGRHMGPAALEAARIALENAKAHAAVVQAEADTLNARTVDLTSRRAMLQQQSKDNAARQVPVRQLGNRLDKLADQLAGRDAAVGSAQALISTRRQAENDSREAKLAVTAVQEAIQALRAEAEHTIRSQAELRIQSNAADEMCSELGATDEHTDAPGTDLHTLAELAATRHRYWAQATSDPQLNAEKDQCSKALDDLNRQLRVKPEAAVEAARCHTAAHPELSRTDYAALLETVSDHTESLSQRIGTLNTQCTHEAEAVQNLEDEVVKLRRDPPLPDRQVTDDVHRALEVVRELTSEREQAVAVRTRSEGRLERATTALERARAAQELLTQADTVLQASLPVLTSAGPLTLAVDPEERAFAAGAGTPAEDRTPASLSQFLASAGTDHLPDKSAADLLPEVRKDLEDISQRLRHQLDGAEERADKTLELLQATLRDCDPETVSGDQLIHLLRGMARRQLAHDAPRHHHDTRQRQDVLQHTVRTFDARVEASAQTAFAAVQKILRDVQATVRDSQLPTTPALGCWGGMPLLKLGGLDTLRIDQRKSAILTILQRWYDPHAASRPAFDADETIWQLVEAVTPNFTAKVLVPSDPLDPEHKSVDRLAVETSGGEGVTFALVLASLLAARRTAANGHRSTTLLLDNPFAKVTKPSFLLLARDVATALGVRMVLLTGVRDLGALTVFPALVQLRVSHRQGANVVVPYDLEDQDLQPLLREGTLYVSATERDTAEADTGSAEHLWPTMSSAVVHLQQPLPLSAGDETA